MTGAYRTEAVILKRKNVGEADRILTVFTREYGKLRLIAKGIRKVKSRRAPHLEVFSRVVLLVHPGKSLDSVSEASTVAAYPRIRSHLEKVSVAYFLCEMVDRLLPEKQEHRDVYALLADTLAAIEKTSEGMHVLTRSFALELLWMLGFLPREKKLRGEDLKSFIEQITERHLTTPEFIRKVGKS
jgi:DNA repair protein RecO (recombination protein O)